MPELSAGMRLRPHDDSTWRTSVKYVELICGSGGYWWARRNSPSGAVTFDTFYGPTLEGWVEIPDFFSVDKLYAHSTHPDGESFLVVEIYELEDPCTESGRAVALAKGLSHRGERMVLLYVQDFKRMHEVEES